MLLRRVAVENVRSFLDRTELRVDGNISILIGPNGGGKTNLLDTIVVMLRRYLFASMYVAPIPTAEEPDLHEFRHNDALNNMVLERHSRSDSSSQLVEIEVELTTSDLDNMTAMKGDGINLNERFKKKYRNLGLQTASEWDLSQNIVGHRYIYKLMNGQISHDDSVAAKQFLRYLQLYEMDSRLRDEAGMASLRTPIIYLAVNRSSSGFQSAVQLANYNEAELKRYYDATNSRTAASVIQLAVGRLAQTYRLLLEQDKGSAASEFRDDPNLKELSQLLADLGYEWDLVTVNPLRNEYDVRLKKQGSSFLVGSASSGERELLTYLFSIFALNVRDALIIVDEPELHLHPKWQKVLLQLFSKLATSTGNQFLLATHSPTFVSPESIQYVSRVYSRDQRSQIVRLDASALPDAKHLFNLVNSQNNERVFLADAVVLVEGISDRIFFEAVINRQSRITPVKSIIEIVSVGGKGLFSAYQKLLSACDIPHFVIADLDYIEQIGSPEIKSLFKTDDAEIKRDVIDNIKSLDGSALVTRIESALQSGSWDDARATWEYIKARRRQLKPNLNDTEAKELRSFLLNKRQEKVFVLEKGALEAYLPEGFRSKDLDKLIRLLAEDDFWERLPQAARDEIQEIIDYVIAATQ